MLERGHEPAEVEAALERLRRERYLDDAGFAERFARSRMAHQGLGRLRVRQGLRQRGVDRGTIDAGIAGALREVDEREVLDALARRYWRQHAAVEPAPRGFPGSGPSCCAAASLAGLVRDRLCGLWPRWSDALDGLEPLEPSEAHGGERE